MPNWPKDEATKFAKQVIAGKIVAGPHVRDACQRHINDRAKSEVKGKCKRGKWDYYYDQVEAAKTIRFFAKHLKLNGGQYEGKPFILLPWQSFIIGSLFGWKRWDDDMRRFRVAFVETAKGSGKSPMCAAVGIKGLVADGEPRAEVYAAATFTAQAMVLFRDACAFYDQSPELQSRLRPSGTGEKRWNLSYLEKGSFFRVISSEKKGQSGPRPSIALLDEIHEHPDGTVIELIRAGFKFRRQPLSFMITNSGHDKSSVCWEYHDMGAKIAAGQVENNEFFAFICSLDDEDLEDDAYLDDESVWPKANPSLPYGLPGYDYIRSQVREARGMPSKMATVKRLCFSVWTEAENPAISKEAWMACEDKGYPDEILFGRRCWGGLDLSAIRDLTAYALMFEPSEKDPFWRLKVWFWLPGIGLVVKEQRDHVPYLAWRDAGYVNAINRKTIEYEFVVADILEICSKFDVQQIAFDRWNIQRFNADMLRLGVTLPEMVEIGTGYKSQSPAIRCFEAKLTEGTLRHDGNSCLTWCSSNVVAVEDASLNRKYAKDRSTGRIDGIAATVMACGILDDEGKPESAYANLSAEAMAERMRF
jgi:phage terminase large subunit-like protein